MYESGVHIESVGQLRLVEMNFFCLRVCTEITLFAFKTLKRDNYVFLPNMLLIASAEVCIPYISHIGSRYVRVKRVWFLSCFGVK